MAVNPIMTYHLKQQTPMIHFQSDEDGATLRASEVKPKLDRFILQQYKQEDKPIPKEWFVSTEHSALNYKMRFKADTNSKTASIPYSMFYANMGEDRKRNPLKMVKGDCFMEIICFLPELAIEIKNRVTDFFIVNTFGFMQGKGFGGYILDNGNGLPIQNQIKNALQSALRCGKVYNVQTTLPIFVEKRQENGKWITPPNIFDNIIKPFHSLMKSGINFGRYERSYLFQYFHKKRDIQYGNDKACVKSNKIAPVVYKRVNATKGELYSCQTYKYVRALLGITEKIEYVHALDTYDKPLKDHNGKVIKDVVKIKSLSDINRYASPVRYRVIGNYVYVFAVPVADELYGKIFEFSSPTGKISIPVPNKNEFNIEDFISSFVQHINTNSDARAAVKFRNEKFEEVNPHV